MIAGTKHRFHRSEQINQMPAFPCFQTAGSTQIAVETKSCRLRAASKGLCVMQFTNWTAVICAWAMPGRQTVRSMAKVWGGGGR